MRKLLAAPFVAALVAGALVTPGARAAGAPVVYADPADDANGLFVTDTGLPLPSEPALDILKVTVSSDGTKLTYAATVKSLSAPPSASTGGYYRLSFGYADQIWRFEISTDTTGGGFYFTNAEDPAGTLLSCNGCAVKFDMRSGGITVTAPLKALSSGMKQYDASVKPLAPGAQLDTFEVIAQRSVVLVTPTADEARGGERTLTL
jgi:hypothetical protein